MMTDFLDTRTLSDWLSALRLGAPMTHGALTLHPLYGPNGADGLAYRTLSEGIGSGEVFVVEAPDAQVPILRVLNTGSLPILIMGGEEVIGGLQNRVVNTSFLVPGGTMFDLPVSCVEQGRWQERTRTFGVGEVAYPSLRRQQVEQVSAALGERGDLRTDQGAVWQDISERHRRAGTQSPTGAMHDVYQQRRGDLLAAEEALPYPSDGPLGMLALIWGRAYCADIFNRPEACRKHWPRLVRSYSLEAVSAEPKTPSVGSAERLLQRTRRARHVAHQSPGLGFDVRLSGSGIVGAALVAGSSVAHLAIFRQS